VHVAGVDVCPELVGEPAQVLLDAGERLLAASGFGEDHGDVVVEHRLVVGIELSERVTDPDGLIHEPTLRQSPAAR
jgi:hypothetical protein